MKALKCIALVLPNKSFDRAIKQMLSSHSPFCSFPFRIQHMAKRLQSRALRLQSRAFDRAKRLQSRAFEQRG
jgi:hypothetical protein